MNNASSTFTCPLRFKLSFLLLASLITAPAYAGNLFSHLRAGIEEKLENAVGNTSVKPFKPESQKKRLETNAFLALKEEILGQKKKDKDPDYFFNRITQDKNRAASLEYFKLRSDKRKLTEIIDTETRRLVALPQNLIQAQFAYLNGSSFVQASCAGHTFANYARAPYVQRQIKGNNEKEFLDRLNVLLGPFVTIPKGYLPIQEGEDEAQFISSFDLNSYPVTRDLWMEVMRKIPDHVPAEERASWAECKMCPVNYIAYDNEDLSPSEIQEFLKMLNEKAQASKCTYDLPDDNQLWYSIRGDVTGENQDPYSKGVTDQNVDRYVTHQGNSNRQIQSVGQKLLNSFGIELGNVWKMSKTIFDPNQPEWGRSFRGGHWRFDVGIAKSVRRFHAYPGYRDDGISFSLVRTCH